MDHNLNIPQSKGCDNLTHLHEIQKSSLRQNKAEHHANSNKYSSLYPVGDRK